MSTFVELKVDVKNKGTQSSGGTKRIPEKQRELNAHHKRL